MKLLSLTTEPVVERGAGTVRSPVGSLVARRRPQVDAIEQGDRQNRHVDPVKAERSPSVRRILPYSCPPGSSSYYRACKTGCAALYQIGRGFVKFCPTCDREASGTNVPARSRWVGEYRTGRLFCPNTSTGRAGHSAPADGGL